MHNAAHSHICNGGKTIRAPKAKCCEKRSLSLCSESQRILKATRPSNNRPGSGSKNATQFNLPEILLIAQTCAAKTINAYYVPTTMNFASHNTKASKEKGARTHWHAYSIPMCAQGSLLAQCRSRENRVHNRNVRETEAQPEAAHSSCSDSFHCTAESSLPRFFSFHLYIDMLPRSRSAEDCAPKIRRSLLYSKAERPKIKVSDSPIVFPTSRTKADRRRTVAAAGSKM